jgi:SAM-dependent methyltransferase
MPEIVLDLLVTDANFDEAQYLAANPDVEAAVADGRCSSGLLHFQAFGRNEERRMRPAGSIIDRMRETKLMKLQDRLDLNMPYRRRGLKYDFLTDAIRSETGIAATDAISGNGYDLYTQQIIRDCADGLVLDCGAGKRPVYYSNVVNYEVADYDSTDVLGVGEYLPFKEGAFDAVISAAVLEHVRDPFKCAAEIARVLRPGGRLYCSVPFLQPEHGYPHHYYNMAPQGLRALFDRLLIIDDHKVGAQPIWALRWIIRSWADGLDGAVREKFLSMSLNDVLMVKGDDAANEDWIKDLSVAKNFELACTTLLFCHKPP